MPHTKQAAKAVRQNKLRTKKNSSVKNEIKTSIKKIRVMIEAKDAKSLESIAAAIKKIDKAAQKGILKKNTAARKKSRLMLAYNKMNKK